jgi:hypothetical protein
MTEDPSGPRFGGVPSEPVLPPVPPPAANYPPPVAGGYQSAGSQPPGYQPAGYQPSQPSGRFDPKSLQNFDPKTINPLDWAIIGAGVVTFIFSTFHYFTYTVKVATFSSSGSVSAWHGLLAPLATLLAIAAAILLAAHLIAKVELPFPVRLAVLAAFGLASLLLLLALFVIPGNTGGMGAFGVKIDKGHGIGYWVSLLAVLAGTGLSYKRFTDTGGTLPGRS